MRKRALSTGLFTVLIAALVGFFASPASADPTWERDMAKAGTPPSIKTCVSTTGANGCWHANGDVWWVKDTSANGYAAETRWYELTPASDGNYYLHRNGACVNGLGSGHWGACNKDYQENGILVWKACNVSISGSLHGCSSQVGCHFAHGGANSTCNWDAPWPPTAAASSSRSSAPPLTVKKSSTSSTVTVTDVGG